MIGDIKAAWQGWHDALGRLTDHQYDCDLYATKQPCAGCAVSGQREQDAYRRFFALRQGVAA